MSTPSARLDDASHVRDLTGSLRMRAIRCIPSSVRGKARFGRWLFHREIRLSGAALLTDRRGWVYSVPSLREPVAQHMLMDGAYEEEIQREIDRLVRSGDVVVDVGANIGALALPCAAAVGPRGHVLAIEASPTVSEYLLRNVKRAGAAQIQVIQALVGTGGVEADFYEAPESNFGMGSRAPQFHARPIKVSVRALDDIVEGVGVKGAVRLIKIDVEGYEADVLRSSRRLLTREDPPVVIFEQLSWAEERAGYTPGEAQRILLDHGYAMRMVGERGWRTDPIADSGNLIAMHRSKLSDTRL